MIYTKKRDELYIIIQLEESERAKFFPMSFSFPSPGTEKDIGKRIKRKRRGRRRGRGEEEEREKERERRGRGEGEGKQVSDRGRMSYSAASLNLCRYTDVNSPTSEL